ncbi:MAG: TetR/AcrR family transcriptional regulator [Bacteroidota bacterium]
MIIIYCIGYVHSDTMTFLNEEKNTLKALFYSIDKGFEIIYGYRFFMIDLNLIMRENTRLHSQFLHIEKLRFAMYKEKIDTLISEGILKKESTHNEYTFLIKQIRILSDYWVASAQIYDATENITNTITSYSCLLKQLFFPYLTEKGKRLYAELIG